MKRVETVFQTAGKLAVHFFVGREHGNIEGVDQVVDKDVQIKCSNISANFFHDGVCESIIDKALCNIDPKAIDSCSYEINRIYEALENIVYGLQ